MSFYFTAEGFVSVGQSYSDAVRQDFENVISNWTIDMSAANVYSVMGGLLSRQCVIATSFARSPALWTYLTAPLFLRAMAEVIINLRWIALDAETRVRQFMLYGLGQERVAIEHQRSLAEFFGEQPANLKAHELWLRSQRHEIFTDVYLGSWSGKQVKDMADESNSFADYLLYTSLGSAAHASWDHVLQLHLEDPSDENSQPVIPKFDLNPEFLMVTAKVLRDTFLSFVSFTGQAMQIFAYDVLMDLLKEYAKAQDDD